MYKGECGVFFNQNTPDHNIIDLVYSNYITQVLTVAKHCARSSATTLQLHLPQTQSFLTLPAGTLLGVSRSIGSGDQIGGYRGFLGGRHIGSVVLKPPYIPITFPDHATSVS